MARDVHSQQNDKKNYNEHVYTQGKDAKKGVHGEF